MEGSTCVAALLIALMLLPSLTSARHLGRTRTRPGHHHADVKAAGTRDGLAARPNFYRDKRPTKRNWGPDTVQVAGSSMPDCSHACGSCSPCRLVMVSFICASLEEAETCPIAYKCMCHNKSFPVP